tara:strand:+ start:41 stop:2146 length:2106 start_codon:yes stop_codon:yes gene_type:complete
MKSPSEYFLIEKNDPTKYVPGEEEASERLVKKLNKIKKKGWIPDTRYADPSVSDKPESVKDQMAKNVAKQDIQKGGGSDPRFRKNPSPSGSGTFRDDDVIDGKEFKKKERKVTTNKPQQKPLGRLVQKVTKERKGKGLKIGDLDYKDSKKLEAQRKARIDTRRNLPSGKPNPKYGKATQKGVENFAQNRGGYGRGRKLTGDEWKKIEGSAKKIASDPSSKAYKDIESKINQNRDYGGKRAQVMNPKQVSQVKKEISKSKTVSRKGGKLTIQRTSRLLDTKTRKGRIANVGSPPTPPDPSLRRSVKGPGSSTGYLSKGTLKFSGDSEYNKLKKILKNTDGRSSNKPPVKSKPVLKPTPVSTGKPPLTNPQSMLRPPRKSTPKFDSAYNKKGDANLRKLLGKGRYGSPGNEVLRGGGPAQVGDPWDPKDYKFDKKKTPDPEFKKQQDQSKKTSSSSSRKAPKPEWGKSTSRTTYKGPTIKNPTIRQYTSPTLSPNFTRPTPPPPVSTSTSGKTSSSKTSSTKTSKVTSNTTVPKYPKSKFMTWKKFRNAASSAIVPFTIGAQSYTQEIENQKLKTATPRRQNTAAALTATADVGAWVGTGKALDAVGLRKRPLVKFAAQTLAYPFVSNYIKNKSGIKTYTQSQTKHEKDNPISKTKPTLKQFKQKYPSYVLPPSGNNVNKGSINLNYGFNTKGSIPTTSKKNK